MLKIKTSWLFISVVTLCLVLLIIVLVARSTGTTDKLSEKNEQNEVDFRYYKTLPGSPIDAKNKGLVEHQRAIELVRQQYFLDYGKELETDFNSTEYQNYVMKLGTAFDLFSEEDMKMVVAFVKFIDFYENYALNEELAKYENKLSQGKLTAEEKQELHHILPIDINDPSTTESA